MFGFCQFLWSIVSHNSFTLYQPTDVSHGMLLLVFLFLSFHLVLQKQAFVQKLQCQICSASIEMFFVLFTFYFMLLLKRARDSSNVIIWALWRQINPLCASVYKHAYTMYVDFVCQAEFDIQTLRLWSRKPSSQEIHQPCISKDNSVKLQSRYFTDVPTESHQNP